MRKKRPYVAVIGAGAFGGWTALYLLRGGARVILLDTWGPGNLRASSGGETRIIRGTYGPAQPYTKMAARALKLWKIHEKQWKRQFFHRTGVLWMARNGEDSYERGSLDMLRQERMAYEELSARDLKNRWPQINLDGVSWAIYEPESGYLSARAACLAVVQAFIAEGGDYRQLAVLQQDLDSGKCKEVKLSDQSTVVADQYIFACGPWLGQLFPDTIGDRVQPTKQEVFFFGTPSGDNRFEDQHLPVWADHRDRFIYGIPAAEGRGFKMADDTRGPEFEPTSGERVVSAEGLKAMREYLAFRFPAMKNAPLLETRVCQYEQSPDSNFIVDRHPVAENVCLLGGGSGHGFKHGPAIGEMMAELVLKDRETDAIFRLARFEKAAAIGSGSRFREHSL
jgi:sarcosine oxidase